MKQLTRPTKPATAQDLRSDWVQGEVGLGACGNRSVVCKPGGRCSSVHGCFSVHAVGELRQDARDLDHVPEHYLEINSGHEFECSASSNIVRIVVRPLLQSGASDSRSSGYTAASNNKAW
jgi:hypothetical protein